MAYLIQKTVNERWAYWMDRSFNWNGLKNNAHVFKPTVAHTIFDGLKESKGEIITLINTDKTLKEKTNSDVSEINLQYGGDTISSPLFSKTQLPINKADT